MNTNTLFRLAGISAILAGGIFVAIQPIHPLDTLESVTTTHWVIIQSLKAAMGLFGLFGLTGLYARQAHAAGWLGFAGYFMFSLFYTLTLPFAFVEAFVLPLLVSDAPTFVAGFLGIFNGNPVETNLGALPLLSALAGFGGYVLGGLLFGLTTLRAGIFPRWAASLLMLAAIAPPLLAGFLQHPLDRMLAVPMGIALIWLGYALWSEQHVASAQSVTGTTTPQLRSTRLK